MSSDNFFLVRKVADRFAVSHEFASAGLVPVRFENSSLFETISALTEVFATHPVDDSSVTFFDALDDAVEFASASYTEYGMQVSTDQDHAFDTLAFRLSKACRLLADSGVFNVSSVLFQDTGFTMEVPDGSLTVSTDDEAVSEVLYLFLSLTPRLLSDACTK